MDNNLKYLTPVGRVLYDKAIKYGLAQFYDYMNGNYIFTQKEYESHKQVIERFMNDNKNDYVLQIENGALYGYSATEKIYFLVEKGNK